MSRDGMAAVSTAEAVTLARDEAAVKLARDTIALLCSAIAALGEAAARLEAAAERADDKLGGRTMAPLPVAHELIKATRQTAAFARGKAVVR